MPVVSIGASNGLAWDSVTKLVTNADPSTLQPGAFDADYAAAAAASPPNMGAAAMFLGKDRMAAAQAAEQMIKSGIAERHYVAGSKERTDQVSQQTATIVDCAARTITTLDLRAKTYRVAPMDSPSSPNATGGNASGPGGENDERLAISVTNTALGAKDVGGQPTSGFRSKMVITETNSSGESHTQNADVLGYYSAYANPTSGCARFGSRQAPGAHGMDITAGFARVMRALGSSGDSRFSVSQSGPPLPLGKLAMYTAMSFSGGGHTGSFVTERGNVRAIAANDPIFSPPSDFTEQR